MRNVEAAKSRIEVLTATVPPPRAPLISFRSLKRSPSLILSPFPSIHFAAPSFDFAMKPPASASQWRVGCAPALPVSTPSPFPRLSRLRFRFARSPAYHAVHAAAALTCRRRQSCRRVDIRRRSRQGNTPPPLLALANSALKAAGAPCVSFDKLDYMNDDPSAVDVLYLALREDAEFAKLKLLTSAPDFDKTLSTWTNKQRRSPQAPRCRGAALACAARAPNSLRGGGAVCEIPRDGHEHEAETVRGRCA